MLKIVVAATALIALVATEPNGLAQNQAAPSLQELLQSQYKVTTTGSDAEGFRIIEPGTVLVIKKEGIIATPHASPHGIAFKLPKVCNNTFKNGILQTGNACAKTTIGSKFLKSGEKVYITKFEVNQKSNKITMNLVECDACNGVTGRSSMKATIIFDFNDQFLQKAEPGQVTDVINEVLEQQRSAFLRSLDGGVLDAENLDLSFETALAASPKALSPTSEGR